LPVVFCEKLKQMECKMVLGPKKNGPNRLNRFLNFLHKLLGRDTMVLPSNQEQGTSILSSKHRLFTGEMPAITEINL